MYVHLQLLGARAMRESAAAQRNGSCALFLLRAYSRPQVACVATKVEHLGQVIGALQRVHPVLRDISLTRGAAGEA
jgi:hypothetical protein